MNTELQPNGCLNTMEHTQVPFSFDSRGSAVIVAVAAHKLAFDEIESFGNQLAQATVDFAGRNVILDLSLVSFLSSIVIGKIFKARKSVLDSGGILSLVVTSQGVLDVFKICQLDRILPIHESLDDALEDT